MSNISTNISTKEYTSELVFSNSTIAQRVSELALELNKTYRGEATAVICVLKGAFIFFSDLVRHLDFKPEIDFVRIASYGYANSSNKAISFTKDVEISLKDKHVLIVEDIIDSGYSMEFLTSQLAARGAKSIKICTLIDKTERRETNIKVDFIGFKVNAGFLVGYGLDYAECFRELPEIHKLEFRD